MAIEIRQARGSMGSIFICPVCPHRMDENSEYEWVDSNMDAYFNGDTIEELAKFLITHGLPQITRAFYLQSAMPAICKCGHGFGDHSFYGETRIECHGNDTEPESISCQCGTFERL